MDTIISLKINFSKGTFTLRSTVLFQTTFESGNFLDQSRRQTCEVLLLGEIWDFSLGVLLSFFAFFYICAIWIPYITHRVEPFAITACQRADYPLTQIFH